MGDTKSLELSKIMPCLPGLLKADVCQGRVPGARGRPGRIGVVQPLPMSHDNNVLSGGHLDLDEGGSYLIAADVQWGDWN